MLLLVLVQLDGRHQSLFSQQRVDLLHELKSSVLLVQDQRIDAAQNDRDLSLVEKQLQLLPVVPLLCIVLRILKAVHR